MILHRQQCPALLAVLQVASSERQGSSDTVMNRPGRSRSARDRLKTRQLIVDLKAAGRGAVDNGGANL